jgi:hypothetical protein
MQHGGPPNALAVAVAERAVAAETGRTDLLAMRLSADFVGPVPVGEIDTVTRLVRVARSAVLAEVLVKSAERDCLHVRVWFVRAADTTEVATPPAPPAYALPDTTTGLGSDFGYGASLDWRFVAGRFTQPGPAAAWVRPEFGLLDDDYQLSGLARTVLVADSASGISSELPWGSWTFLNIDLDVHLVRPFEGEWVLMEAMTQVGNQGSALATSVLSDERGRVGGGLQTLITAPQP